jgi:glycosyltransferase involved in cell wall biosynthesis
MTQPNSPTHASRPTSLSIVIPVYNEKNYFLRILERVEAAALPEGMARQIIIVDDHSTDGTADLVRQLGEERKDLVVQCHAVNQGKGAALHTGFNLATGDLILVQDADFEYHPADYMKLLRPILDDRADVVYGSRFAGVPERRVLYYWHSIGNQFLTALSNMLTNLNLTDMECCYKLFRRSLLDRIRLREKRFGFEPEFTAKIAALGPRIYEVPVSYDGRSYAEGKKINWKDGLSALRCIIKYNIFSRT